MCVPRRNGFLVGREILRFSQVKEEGVRFFAHVVSERWIVCRHLNSAALQLFVSCDLRVVFC